MARLIQHKASRRRLGRAVAAAASLVAAGCASTGPTTGDPGHNADDKMIRMAQAEAKSRRLSPLDAPIPPGVEPEVLALRPVTDRRGRLSLDHVLLEVAPPPDPDAGVAATEPPDADAQAEALRLYVRGRDAALQNRHLSAITDLEKAAALDPTSPTILRQLAQSYLAMSNSLKAVRLYERLLEVAPDDSEALFVLGLAATNRRDFERAASFLARPRVSGGSFDHDPAADFLADYMLATSLRQLGYDRAWIELSRSALDLVDDLAGPTIYSGRVESLYRQRARIQRAIGDAHCRLGEYDEALDAYRLSAQLPSAEPEALHPRVLYANLRLGRVWGAQLEMLAAIGTDGSPVSEHDIRLCAYLAETVGSPDVLAEAVIDRHRTSPDDPSLVRAAAVLLSRERSVQLLRDFLDRRPDDLEVFTQLLRWLVDRDRWSAVSVTIAMAGTHPGLGDRYGDALGAVGPGAAPLLEVVEAQPPSPARTLVAARLLTSIGADGRAWRACSEALETWPDDQMLRLQQIECAARLGEPQLLDEAIAAAAAFDDARTWAMRARGRRALGQTEAAVAAAVEASDRAPDDADVWTELARCHLEHGRAVTADETRRQHADNAVIAARRALELVPTLDEPYAILLVLYSPGGLLNDGILADEVEDELMRANPQSRLEARLRSQRNIRNGRYERALERLLVLCDNDPSDLESLQLLVTVWGQLNRLDAALRWLEPRLEDRPGDPSLLAQWVAVSVQRARVDEAMSRVEEVLAAEPVNDAARLLLESLCRRRGDIDRAVTLGEERLLERPRGIRRELELAALYAGAGRDDASVTRLEWILEQTDVANFDLLVSALGVVGRLGDELEGRDELALSYVERIVALYPEAPLQVYGSGLRALAALGPLDERFDELAATAAAHAGGGAGPSLRDAEVWRQLAQALVDADHPAAAGRALRARLRADAPLDNDARTLLAMVALVTDARANRADDSIKLVEQMVDTAALSRLFGADRPQPRAELFYSISIMYALLGSDTGSEQLLRETIRLDPEHPMALNNLGYTRLEMGMADAETAAWIERAHELSPDNSNVLDTVGWWRYKTGNFEGDHETPGALPLIRESMDQANQESPEVLDHLGDTLWRLGNADGAVKAWSRAAELLNDPERRRQEEQLYIFLQTRQWGLLVADPSEIYHRQHGRILTSVEAKLREAADGGTPDVAPTFREMGMSDWAGDSGDGGP